MQKTQLKKQPCAKMQKSQKNKFEIVAMPPQNTNSVVVCNGENCAIFDPWGRADDWKKYLAQRGLNLRAIYTTHGHPDHISAAPDLVREFGVPWYMHADDFCLLGWGNDLLEYFGMPKINLNDCMPVALDINTTKILGGLDVKIIEMPGHTPGGVGYYFPSENVLLIGDSVFQTSIGRYDLPGGNLQQLTQSIANLYKLNLPDNTLVVHGHGPNSSIGFLRQNNPFFHE